MAGPYGLAWLESSRRRLGTVRLSGNSVLSDFLAGTYRSLETFRHGEFDANIRRLLARKYVQRWQDVSVDQGRLSGGWGGCRGSNWQWVRAEM